MSRRYNPHSIVKLNVIGRLFTTTLGTLVRVPKSMLGVMFSGKYISQPNSDDGAYFIDRDGTHFRHILNFLRDMPIYSFDHLSQAELIELQREAEYYGLEKVMFLIQFDAEWEKKYKNVHLWRSEEGIWYACMLKPAPRDYQILYVCKQCKSARIGTWGPAVRHFGYHRYVSAKQPTLDNTNCPYCKGFSVYE